MSDGNLRDAEREWVSSPSCRTARRFVMEAMRGDPEAAVKIAEEVHKGLAAEPPPRPSIDWELWRGAHESRSFSLPVIAEEAQLLPLGVIRAQVTYSKFTIRERAGQWGPAGHLVRLQLAFKDKHGSLFRVWTSIHEDSSERLQEFARATCPWKRFYDEFAPTEALGRFCMITIGYGYGPSAEGEPAARFCIKKFAADTK